jgi:hypothetical protein
MLDVLLKSSAIFDRRKKIQMCVCPVSVNLIIFFLYLFISLLYCYYCSCCFWFPLKQTNKYLLFCRRLENIDFIIRSQSNHTWKGYNNLSNLKTGKTQNNKVKERPTNFGRRMTSGGVIPPWKA